MQFTKIRIEFLPRKVSIALKLNKLMSSQIVNKVNRIDETRRENKISLKRSIKEKY
jgi:hypothetical protein